MNAILELRIDAVENHLRESAAVKQRTIECCTTSILAAAELIADCQRRIDRRRLQFGRSVDFRFFDAFLFFAPALPKNRNPRKMPGAARNTRRKMERRGPIRLGVLSGPCRSSRLFDNLPFTKNGQSDWPARAGSTFGPRRSRAFGESRVGRAGSESVEIRISQRGLRPQPKQRQKNLRAKKSPLERAAGKFRMTHFFATDFFAILSLN